MKESACRKREKTCLILDGSPDFSSIRGEVFSQNKLVNLIKPKDPGSHLVQP